jgi:DUF3037 family protein
MRLLGFEFAILRYVHDVVTGEFVNIGVVAYSREERQFAGKVSSRYGRLSSVFSSIDPQQYHRYVNYVMRMCKDLSTRIAQPDMFRNPPAHIQPLLAQIIPPDDSSLVFGGCGGGLTKDLDVELQRLYDRLVLRYAKGHNDIGRDNNQVWQVYEPALEELDVIAHLASAKIVLPTYEYSFPHAWQNEHWHPIEAVSFDLRRPGSIQSKSMTWVGRAQTLFTSPEMGQLTLLLGAPQEDDLRKPYDNAKDNLEHMLGDRVELVEEHETDEFAQRLRDRIRLHS